VGRACLASSKIIVIEFNPFIPFDTRFINPPGENYGNSALSLKELADENHIVIVTITIVEG